MCIPVGDLAQHSLLGIMFLTQNGYCLGDDVNARPIPGMEKFRGLVDVDDTFPLTFFDQYMLAEITAELATSCYAGMLVLQAMGLGGWMFDGIDRFSMLGASGDPRDPRARLPLRRGRALVGAQPDRARGRLRGLLPSALPGHARGGRGTLRAEVRQGRAAQRGHARRLERVRAGALERAWCTTSASASASAVQAQYLFDSFGKFPATVPSLMILNYLQAHHLDLDFYDQKFRPGAYLDTHARHMETWH